MTTLYTLVVITATAFSPPTANKTPGLSYDACQIMAKQQNTTRIEYRRSTAICVTPDQADRAAAAGIQLMSQPLAATPDGKAVLDQFHALTDQAKRALDAGQAPTAAVHWMGEVTITKSGETAVVTKEAPNQAACESGYASVAEGVRQHPDIQATYRCYAKQ